MEDLTKPFKFKNKAKQLEFNIPNMPKAGFIASRMNKDNFWNLMFFSVSFTGFACGFIIPQLVGGIVFWLSIIGAILFVKRNSPLTFNKEKLEFTTAQGNKVKKSGVGFIFLIIISFFLSAGIVGLITEYLSIDNLLLEQSLFVFFFTFLQSLYCILCNFPISVYFKKEAWVGGDTSEFYSSNGHWNNNLFKENHFTHPSNYYRDIRNSFSEGNIYHRK
jgi:hypothetical protein